MNKIQEEFLKFVEDMLLVIDCGLSPGEDFFLDEKIKKIDDKSIVVFDVFNIGLKMNLERYCSRFMKSIRM